MRGGVDGESEGSSLFSPSPSILPYLFPLPLSERLEETIQQMVHGSVCTIEFYKITKIVRALSLTERRVCMRVCKHGCDIKMFCFSRANHASTNLKKVLS